MQGIPTPTPESIGLTTGTTGLALLATETQAEAQSVIGATGGNAGNRLINGGMAIDQRNAGNAQTITAGAALAYAVDRWYAYCTGANVTGQQVQGATAGRFRYQFTGGAGVTAIGFGQRIEQLNSADLAGTTATLSVDLANSLLTTVTWTAYYATTADTFGTLASPTKTQIATGTFTVNSTVTRYSTQIAIPIEAVTGIEIVLSVGAQTSGTWTIGDVQLESGAAATPYQPRLITGELALCQRYYYKTVDAQNYHSSAIGGVEGAGIAAVAMWHPVDMRVVPTVTLGSGIRLYSFSVPSAIPTIITNRSTRQMLGLYLSFSGGVGGQAAYLYNALGANSFIEASSEL